MKKFHQFAVSTAVSAAAAVSALACLLPAMSHAQSATASASVAVAADLTDGEVRKVDKDTKKITIKHGAIKNLDMPGMTMLFQAGDPAFLDAIKPGDKIRFRAEMRNGALVVTQIQVVK